MSFVATVVLTLAAAPDEKPIVLNDPRKMEVGQTVTFAEARKRGQWLVEIDGKKTFVKHAGSLSYAVHKVNEKDLMIVLARVEVGEKTDRVDVFGDKMIEKLHYFFVQGMDTSKLADGKTITLPGVFKITKTMKTKDGATLFVAELVK